MLESIKRERLQMISTLAEISQENKFQRKCCIVLALATIVFIGCKDAMLLFGSGRSSWVVSVIASLWSLLAYALFRPGTIGDMYQYVWKVVLVGVVAAGFILK